MQVSGRWDDEDTSRLVFSLIISVFFGHRLCIPVAAPAEAGRGIGLMQFINPRVYFCVHNTVSLPFLPALPLSWQPAKRTEPLLKTRREE